MKYNRNRRRTLSFTAVSALSLILTAPAFAEDVASADEGGLADIVVTAQRRSENVQKVPIAVTALGERDLEAFNIRNSRDLGGRVPSLYIPKATNAATTQTYSMRGLGQTDGLADPTVGLYVDDVYIPRAFGALFDIPDLERIEVLRGPQGTLYGRNATGGAIKYVTREPGNDFRLKATIGFGNYGQQEFQGAISGPLIRDKLFISLAAVQNYSTGYVYNATLGKRVGRIDNVAGRVKLRFTPTEKLEIKLSGDAVIDRSDTSVYTPNNAPAGSIIDPYVTYEGAGFDGTKAPASKLDIGGGALSIGYDIGENSKIKLVSAYRGFGGPVDNQLDGLAERRLGTLIDYRERSWTEELNLTGSSGRLKYTGGLFFMRERFILNPSVNQQRTTVTIGEANLLTLSYAAYGQLDYALTDRLSITVGGRYTYEKRSFESASYTGNTALQRLTLNYRSFASNSYESFDPKVGIQYQLTPRILTYASFAQGFNAGGFSLRATATTSATAPFGPQNVNAYEVGAKADLLPGLLRTNVALFHNDVTGFQATAFDPVLGISRILNAGNLYTEGFEVESTLTPLPGLTIGGSVSYTRSNYTRFDNISGLGTSGVGNKLVFAPKWIGAVQADYIWPSIVPGQIRTSADFRFVSRTYFDVTNTVGNDSPPQKFLNGNITYTLPGGNLWLGVEVKNILDDTYRQFNNIRATQGVNSSAYNAPRTFMVRAGFKY